MKIALAAAASTYSFFQAPNAETDPPLGILHLATALKGRAECRIFDGQLSRKTPENLAREILAWQPDVIGFSVNFSTVAANTRRMAAYIRNEAAEIPILFGGNYATFQARDFIAQDYCDAVFLHEAEISLCQYVDWLQGRRQDLPDGILYAPGKQREAEERPFCGYYDDLDRLPPCDYDLFDDPARYAKSIVSSRGCPYSCIYCSTRQMWKKWRGRSAANVVGEMLSLHEKYGAEQIYFSDDIFIVNKKRLYEMCRALTPYAGNLKWGFSTRLETLHDDMIPMLAEAGVSGIFLGIESGSDRVLSQMARRYSQAQVIDKIDRLADHGITASASFIIGLPYETREDVEQTFATMRRLRTHRVLLNIFTPLSGTDSLGAPEAFGIELHEGFDPERAVVGHGYVHFNTRHLSAREIRHLWLEGQAIVLEKGRQRNAFETEMEKKRYGMLA